MKLNDEEQDILAGKAGPVPQLALKHQIKVGEFFGAPDFVSVTQAHIMADTESLGDSGVAWLEELVAQSGARLAVPTITDPRGLDLATYKRLKQTEAMAAGVPVVATAIGAEGLPLRHGEHLLIANTAQEQIEAICALLSDPAQAAQLAANALRHVQEHCSWDAVAERFLAQCGPRLPQNEPQATGQMA